MSAAKKAGKAYVAAKAGILALRAGTAVCQFKKARKTDKSDKVKISAVNWKAIIAEVCGSLTGMLFGGYLVSGFKWGIPAIFAMIVALAVYFATGGAKPKEA